jgi:tryptophanyl-tRNA synthetase
VRVFSGIQPTGKKHLGNYIGAIRHYVADQSLGEAFYCVVDLHSISVAYDQAELAENTLDTAAALIAAGLDPDRCTLFVQSHVAEHAEASWLLSGVATFGELRRMTQFKDKGEGRDSVSAALLTYPVLMAGDILLYRTDRVPVGDDQRQHVELARDIAQRFNGRFGQTFVVPEAAIARTGGRVMDLQDPSRKMSTTGGTPLGTVLLLDPPDVIVRKFRSAVTDSGREVRRGEGKEGVSNLIEIHAIATGTSVDDVERAFEGSGYGDFKQAVAEAVLEMLRPVQARYAELRADEPELRRILAAGAERARAVSAPTIAEMKRRMGFLPA